MKYKILKSLAHNWGHSFTSDSNIVHEDFAMSYIVRAGVETGSSELRVDLLTGKVSPSSLLTDPARRSLEHYVRWFPELAASQGVPIEVIQQADAVLTLDLARQRAGTGSLETINVPFEIRVRLVDDLGREHLGKVVDVWPASREPLFRRKPRWWQFWRRAV